ncbi:MAG: PEP-CTERM sorting domain-containing protein [Gemmatimonadaceae bacterium]
MKFFSQVSATAVAVALLAVSPLAAQTTVVVTPASPGWGYTDQAGVGSATIDGTYPRSGNGSLDLSMPTGSDKAYFGTALATPQSLTSVTSASFDWYRSSSTVATPDLAPSFHFIIASNDGTGTKYSDLVWEWAYNNPANSSGTAPTDQWVTSDIANGDFWRSMSGPTDTSCQPLTSGAQKFSTLADWATSCYANDNPMIVGMSVGFGRVSNFAGAVDNVTVGFNGDAGTTYNFETTSSTPEPSSIALLGTGLFGLVPIVRRRRKR